MGKRNPFVFILSGLILLVIGYCFWINIAH